VKSAVSQPVSGSSPVPLPDLYFDSFSYPVAPIVSSVGDIV